MQRKEGSRLWRVSYTGLDFPHEFLPVKELKVLWKSFALNWDILGRLAEFRPDVIIVADNLANFLTTVSVSQYARDKSIPLIVWTGIFPASGKSLINSIRKVIYRRAMCFLAYGEGTKATLIQRFGIDGSAIFTGTQGYPESLLEPFAQCRPDYRARYERNKFLFIGYLRRWPDKGVSDLLEAFKRMVDKGWRAELTIMGDGPDKPKLISLAQRYPVKFCGYLDGAEKYRELTLSKFLVLPSHRDSWGWVVNEAMYFGVPVIVSRAAMASEMVDEGGNGYLSEPSDPADLALKVEKALKLDYESYLDMAKRAKSTSVKYGLDRAVACFLSGLSAVGKHGGNL